jgi:hypothetical protein
MSTKKEGRLLHNRVLVMVDRVAYFRDLVGAILTSSSPKVDRWDSHLSFGSNLVQFEGL